MLSTVGSRLAIAVASLSLVVAGCSFKADITLTKTYTNVRATSGAAFSVTQQVDMAAEAPGAWRRRGDLKSLDLVAIDATMTANHLGTAAPASGELWLTRAGFADVQVGAWSKTISATAPDSIAVTMPASGNALIMDALRNDGKFGVKATASTTAAIDVDVKVVLHLGVNFEPSL